MNKNTSARRMKYRDPEDITNSSEEVHPNISAKSYHRFVKAERRRRLDELESKSFLAPEEEKEKAELEYKFLPVDKEIGDKSFAVCNDTAPTEKDYSRHLIYLVENNDISSFLKRMDEHDINLEEFEELIYLNLSSAIKEEKHEMGYLFCKLGLLARWARMYGRGYLCKLQNHSELEKVFRDHYEASKRAIDELNE